MGDEAVATYRFANCTVEVCSRCWKVTTTFADGVKMVARPVVDEENIERALELGYTGSDESVTWQMTRHHDVLHSLIAEAMGNPWSSVLWHAAHELPQPDKSAADREERLVLLLQRLVARDPSSLFDLLERYRAEPA